MEKPQHKQRETSPESYLQMEGVLQTTPGSAWGLGVFLGGAEADGLWGCLAEGPGSRVTPGKVVTSLLAPPSLLGGAWDLQGGGITVI